MARRPHPIALLDVRDIEVKGYRRLIWRRHRATPLGARPAPSRLSDPQLRYSVLYPAQTLRCAFAEVVLRDRFIRMGANRMVDAFEVTLVHQTEQGLRLGGICYG